MTDPTPAAATAEHLAALRHIATQVRKHRARLAETFNLYGREAADREVSTFVMVGSRRKFLADDYDRVEFYAICRGLGREFERLHAADLNHRHAVHLARTAPRALALAAT